MDRLDDVSGDAHDTMAAGRTASNRALKPLRLDSRPANPQRHLAGDQRCKAST
jgi:hypothetical protein